MKFRDKARPGWRLKSILIYSLVFLNCGKNEKQQIKPDQPEDRHQIGHNSMPRSMLVWLSTTVLNLSEDFNREKSPLEDTPEVPTTANSCLWHRDLMGRARVVGEFTRDQMSGWHLDNKMNLAIVSAAEALKRGSLYTGCDTNLFKEVQKGVDELRHLLEDMQAE